MPDNVAFYTTGDTHHAIADRAFDTALGEGTVATVSNLYEMFAVHHARIVFPADGIISALEYIRSLDSGSVRNLYFIGHGMSATYAFHVTPGIRGQVFVNTMGETLGWSGSLSPFHQYFIREIVRVADRTQRFGVYFYSCFTGRGNLLQQVSDELRTAGINHRVSGTTHYWTLMGQSSTRGGRVRVGYRETARLEIHLPS
jgi:hypothetical protein